MSAHPMVIAAARALCRAESKACNVNADDNWKVYSDDYIANAQCALDGCAALELLEACEAALRYDKAIRRCGADGSYELDPLGAVAEGVDLDVLYFDWMLKARAAHSKATGSPT